VELEIGNRRDLIEKFADLIHIAATKVKIGY